MKSDPKGGFLAVLEGRGEESESGEEPEEKTDPGLESAADEIIAAFNDGDRDALVSSLRSFIRMV